MPLASMTRYPLGIGSTAPRGEETGLRRKDDGGRLKHLGTSREKLSLQILYPLSSVIAREIDCISTTYCGAHATLIDAATDRPVLIELDSLTSHRLLVSLTTPRSSAAPQDLGDA